MTNQADAYIPGVCNINRVEIAYRRKAGHIGLGIYIVLLIALLVLPLGRYFRFILFLPAFIAAIGYLQARNKFCVAYGAAGQQNATEGSDKASEVMTVGAKARDKQKARRLNLQATGIALLGTLIALILPVR